MFPFFCLFDKWIGKKKISCDQGKNEKNLFN